MFLLQKCHHSKRQLKRLLTSALVLLPLCLSAQHSRQALVQPNYDDYNLRFWPRQIVVTQQYDKGNDINFQEKYLFDSVGNLTEYSKRGFGGERITVYPLTMEEISAGKKYTFDYDGDLLEMRGYDLKNRLISSTHYIYGEGGNLIQSIEYEYSAENGVILTRAVSFYDKKERLKTVCHYTADELLIRSEEFKYDRKGNWIKRTQTFYEEEEQIVTVETRSYNYDSHGNWIQCIYSLDGKQIYKINREITYYGN